MGEGAGVPQGATSRQLGRPGARSLQRGLLAWGLSFPLCRWLIREPPSLGEDGQVENGRWLVPAVDGYH